MFLLRHGETEFNRAGRGQGRFDSPLTPKGIAQAEAIARHVNTLIAGTGGWTIVSSPLGRALATAEIIQKHVRPSAPITSDDRLREVSLGAWDGLTRDEITARWPGALGPSLRQSWLRSCPDGETIDAVIARLTDWLHAHQNHHRLIVVTHGISGSLLRGIYADIPCHEMLRLPTPQDSFHHLADGTVHDVPCPGLDH